jgi:predicted alpha/beta-hydrolase family hydrolase
VYRAASPSGLSLVLAHGAGAGQLHPFLTSLADRLAARGIDVVTFNFVYMEQGRRSPDRAPALEETWRAVIGDVLEASLGRRGALFMGGKSMGGRIASQVLAAEPDGFRAAVAGLVLLGYPLHPPGRPAQARVEHLPRLTTSTLIVQGSRDDFGTPDEVRSAFASSGAPFEMLVIEGGDHSYKIPRNAGHSPAEVVTTITDHVSAWMRQQVETGSRRG